MDTGFRLVVRTGYVDRPLVRWVRDQEGAAAGFGSRWEGRNFSIGVMPKARTER